MPCVTAMYKLDSQDVSLSCSHRDSTEDVGKHMNDTTTAVEVRRLCPTFTPSGKHEREIAEAAAGIRQVEMEMNFRLRLS